MTKAELLAELRGIETGGSPFSSDTEVGEAAQGAAKAIWRRVYGPSADLPDKDAEYAASRGVKDIVPGQSGPDRVNDSDDDAA